ncbi:MAG: septation protein SepH [Streptosporangiaceae bacterium]|jgi:hypothetical protein
MQELRFVAVSEDGSYAVLAIPGRSGRFMLPIDDRLRAVAKGQFSRLAQYEIEVENPLRPKEIQARIRAGETVEEIADAAGIPVDRVRWFEGPVLAERGYVAQQAQNASVRRQGDSTPGPRLGGVVAERLTELGADPEDAQWDSRKHGDGSWQVQLAFRAGGRLHIAEWLFDPRRRHVSPADDNAERLSLPEAELPAPTGGSLGAATVTPIRPRPDRSQAPAAPDPVAAAYEEPARAAAQAASPASFTPARPPVGRSSSHAAPQTGGGSRTASADAQPNGTGPVFTDGRGADGRDAGDPGFGGRSSGEQRTGGHRTDSPEPRDRDHAADDREGNDTAGRERSGRPAMQETVAEHVAAPGPDRRDADSGDPGPRDPDTAGAAGIPAAEAPTRAGDAPAADAPAADAPAAQAPAAQAPAGRAPANGRRPAQAPAPSPAQPPADERADEVPPRGRGKKTAGSRGRRSSVPSWDEIMLGNSRQPD